MSRNEKFERSVSYEQKLSTEELLSDWMKGYFMANSHRDLLRIRRATPLAATRDFFDRFKIEIGKLDGTGQNPTRTECFVVYISYTNQIIRIEADTCDSIPDLLQ